MFYECHRGRQEVTLSGNLRFVAPRKVCSRIAESNMTAKDIGVLRCYHFVRALNDGRPEVAPSHTGISKASKDRSHARCGYSNPIVPYYQAVACNTYFEVPPAQGCNARMLWVAEMLRDLLLL